MIVLTFTPEIFAHECHRLERRVAPAPDLVVGIASGGEHVARQIFPTVAHASVTCRRPSTAIKAAIGPVFSLVRILPRAMRDGLRMMEARRLRGGSRREAPHVDIPEEALSARDILVVDDAVDSGTTMRAVVQALRKANPAARIRTAAIVVTMPEPQIWPDTVLFTNVLIRFPWARDYR